MSWMKRGQGGVPPPAADQSQYGAPQPYGNQQNMYPNYQGTPSNIAQHQQQYWQQQQQQQTQPAYNQQYGQMYPQQSYGNNANQYYQQPTQYNQNFSNQNYNSTQQAYPQNYYPNQSMPQQSYPQNKVNNDGWEDNWDWGWEDSSKQKPVTNQIAQQLNTSQAQACTNANVIEESFASTNTWNWAMEEKKEPQEQSSTSTQANKELAQQPTGSKPQLSSQHESNIQSNVNHPSQPEHSSSEVKTLSDKDVVKEQLPNLALGKRFHLENLTPQWSIESQMSQESSDGPHTQSEGTFRSENQSRNSSKSSPGLNTDNSNFNYTQSGIEEMYTQGTEWSNHSNDDSTKVDSHKSNSSRRESHDELSSSLQDMSISNTDNTPAPDNDFEHTLHDSLPPPVQPPPSTSPVELAQPLSSSMPPPPPVSAATNQPAPIPSGTLPPPTSFPPPSASQNPFKHAGPFSHRNISKNHSNIPSQPFPPQMANTNLTSPSVVSKISQGNRMPIGFGANLETTPDNSERPDQPQAASFAPLPVSQQIPDNMEVAPQRDRNEYLQTEHLSSVDFGENTDFTQNVPPPGLRRMVVGQQETEYGQNLNISGDEPPPGLARMVPGQQTESDGYNQSNDNYLERHVDGQITDNGGRPFRQADGQQTPDNYSQGPPNRGSDRRPIGLDRMVPGEPSNNEYMQYQAGNYGGSNEPRVVTGVDHDYPLHVEAGPPEVREQNVDGSDYTETAVRNPTRNVIGLREVTNDSSVEFVAAPGDEQRERELTMEGENLQDLSVISGAEMTFSREQMFDVVSGNVTELANDASESVEYPANGSRRQSVNRVNTSGEDSDRDRTFKSSPRRDREKQKSSRDRDRDRERDKDGRYSRGDRKYDRDPGRRSGRDGRRSEKDRRDRDREGKERDRLERDGSPEAPRQRRSARGRRYDTEDTDYYSDRERERSDRADRTDRRYRDIDPTRKYGNLRREEEQRRRGEAYSSPSRAGSREATATDEEPPATERRRRDRDRDRDRRWRTDRSERGDRADRPDRPDRPDRETDPYYLGGYGAYGSGYGDPFLLQRQQYSYYERLRRTDPAAYMRLYKQLMAAPHAPHAPHAAYTDGYGSLGYEVRGEERASVHSGRSSAAGLKPADTVQLSGGNVTCALRRELNTDASLNLQLEESTVRSERMTPFKYSTAHVKGTLSARHVVVVRAAYPADGRPATVQLLPLAAATARLPARAHLLAYPGPLLRGVTHKKSVIEYCSSRAAEAAAGGGAGGAADPLGRLLVWELLALLLRQNGVVVGTDIAELLMNNAREHEYAHAPSPRIGRSRPSLHRRRTSLPPRRSPAPLVAGSRAGSGAEGERVVSPESNARPDLPLAQNKPSPVNSETTILDVNMHVADVAASAGEEGAEGEEGADRRT
ncbi:Protein transport protein Sec16A [Papilio xuthus]|uniref:Protein transport protein Sec16A n=1 Tax=Papilio xuthus TaxID=66420 RepID=A0A194PQR9_PAPXU|nr:Protein transport protein Sec16A [Papilio xuthus]